MKLLFIPIQTTEKKKKKKKKERGGLFFLLFKSSNAILCQSTLLSIVLFVVVFTISYLCAIFSPKGNLFYIDSSFHCGKLPDEIQIRQTELVLCKRRVR